MVLYNLSPDQGSCPGKWLYYLYQDYQGSRTRAYESKEIREKVIGGLLKNYNIPETMTDSPNPPQILSRLRERHFIGEDSIYKPNCIVCSDRNKHGWKRVQTNCKCFQCDLPMCYYKCHELYHTVADYRRAAGHMFWND